MSAISEADRFFGKVAVEREFLTQAQLDECFALQEKSHADGAPKALGDILVDRGFLTDAQIEEVQQRVRFVELRDQDRAFGKQCVKKGWITLHQLDAALEKQRKVFLKKGEIRSLGEILVQEKMLSPDTQEKVVAMFGTVAPGSSVPAAAPAPTPPPPPAPEPAPAPTEATEIRAAPAAAPTTQKVPFMSDSAGGTKVQARKACPLCKTLVLSGLFTCPVCGGIFCPTCNHVSAARSPACLGCGRSFAGPAAPVIPHSMAMWLQPPYVFVLGGIIVVALTGLILFLPAKEPPKDDFEKDYRTPKNAEGEIDPALVRRIEQDKAAKGQDSYLTNGRAGDPPPIGKKTEPYAGTVVTLDGSTHTGRIREYADRVVVATQFGELSIPRKMIKEIRKDGEKTATPPPANDPKTTRPPPANVPTPPANTPPPANTAPPVRPPDKPPATAFEPEPDDDGEEIVALPPADNSQCVKLKDGREFSGQVTRKGDQVEIRLKMGTTTVAATDVVEIVESADQRYVRLAQEADGKGAPAHVELAAKMRADGKEKWARREYLRAIADDPHCEGAHRALGHLSAGGRWRSAEGTLRCAEILFATQDLDGAAAALEAVLRASEDPNAKDAPAATKDQKLRAGTWLARTQLRAGNAAKARETAGRLLDWSSSAQRSRVKVVQDAILKCPDSGMVELRSDEIAVNLLDGAPGALALKPGPQPLWDERVLDIVVRREAAAIVGKVKDLLDQASRSATADPDGAQGRYESAEALCDDANDLYPGFAKSYQLEAVRQQIPILFARAQSCIKKANEAYPTKYKYAYDKTTKKMTPESVKEFAGHQRDWNTQVDRCKQAVDKALRIAEKYPNEMQDRVEALRGYQQYLNETIPGARKEIEAFRSAIGK